MLRLLKIQNLTLPKLYIAENKKDAELARENGLPFVLWRGTDRELLINLLRPTMEKIFPGIIWDNVLGPKRRNFKSVIVEVPGDEAEDYLFTPSPSVLEDDESYSLHMPEESWHEDEDGMKYEIVDIATNYRTFEEEGSEGTRKRLSISEYIGDISSQVNVDLLLELSMLPSFVGELAQCIRRNLVGNVRWREGYNKKLGATVGTHSLKPELDNLIILDVSGSIPRGISATMLTLVDTMRTQLNADLIITASCSKFYPMGVELPDPQTLRDTFDSGNEGKQFYDILKKLGDKHYGHVFSFGDHDRPGVYINKHVSWEEEPEEDHPLRVSCETVHQFFVGYNTQDLWTGYSLFLQVNNGYKNIEFHHNWTDDIRRH